MQPIWFHLDGATLLKQFGNERMSRFQPLRALFDAKMPVGGGSDHMQKIGSLRSINPYNPWLGMWIAVARRCRHLDTPLHPEGGLTREEVKKVNDKIPFFGDLPLIGRLFRSKGESAQKRNLLIFVTANLVSPGGSPKKQSLKNTPANSLFQNPTIVTPTSAEPRTRSGGK